MTLNLDAIKQRAEAATKGPWEEFTPHSDTERFSAAVGMASLMDDIALNVLSNRDAEFIAAARTDVPALVAEVERLRHQLSHVEVDRDHYKNQSAEVERLRGVVDRVRKLHAPEVQTVSVPVFDEFDSPTQTDTYCAGCGGWGSSQKLHRLCQTIRALEGP